MKLMKTISVSGLLTSIKSGKNEFPSCMVEGDLLNWDVIDDFNNKKKSVLSIELADDLNSIQILLSSTSTAYSTSDYFIAFAHPGIQAKFSGNFKVASINKKILISDTPSIVLSLLSKAADISIRGCPSYKKWNPKTKFKASETPLSLSTAADLFDKERKSPIKKKKSYKFQEKIKFAGKKSFGDNLRKEEKTFDPSIDDFPVEFSPENYKWFFNETGSKLLSIPLIDPFFCSSINYSRPRLSFVYSFNPPEQGSVALYWMTAELQWMRIGEVSASKLEDYEVLKHFINKIETKLKRGLE